MFWRLTLSLALALVCEPLVACETEPDFFILPGETKKQAEDRTEKTHSDQWVIRWYHEENYVTAKAPVIYIGKIVSVVAPKFTGSEITWPSARVQPLKAIKGSLPSSARTLTSKETGGSCGFIGDGDGAWGPVGKLIFVFEGLPKSEHHPNGIQSFNVSAARTFELLDPLAAFLDNSVADGERQ